MGPVRGPHTCTSRAQETRAASTDYLPVGRAAGGGVERLALDAPHHGKRSLLPRQPPASPTAHNVRKRMQAKGPVVGSHARTPAPAACGQRAPTACRMEGQPGEGDRLTPDSPQECTGHLPGNTLLPPQKRAPQLARALAVGSVTCSHTATSTSKEQGQPTPTACPWDRQPGEGKRLTPDAPHKGTGLPPLGRPPSTPTVHNASSQKRALWDR